MELTEKPSGRGRRRRRRRRRGGGGSGGGGNGSKQNRNRNQGRAQDVAFDPNDCRMAESKSGAFKGEPEELNAFNLFCAYHLGLTRDNGYRFQSVKEIARRFNVDQKIVRDRIERYGIQTEELKKIGFDAKFFQPDIQLAPEGINKREIARTIWDEFSGEITVLPDPTPEEDAAMLAEGAEESTDADAAADAGAETVSEEAEAKPAAKAEEAEDATEEAELASDEAELASDEADEADEAVEAVEAVEDEESTEASAE
jgi:hypothetical protein